MDLSTCYMGLALKNPLVIAASPLSSTVSSIRRLEDFGASAVVLHSIFEEQLASGEKGSAVTLSGQGNDGALELAPKGLGHYL